jgi:hypothetical protein
MPLIKPHKKDGKWQPLPEFIEKCMSDDTMVKEFKDPKQRYAVCMKTYRDKDKK